MSQGKPIRVMIVDDHAVVRSGLKAFLMVFDDLELVGEASGGNEAVQVVERMHPDVILMDLIMPDMDGAATTKVIRGRWPEVQVVALTSFREDELVKNALQAGAIGYLLKMSARMSWLMRSAQPMWAGLLLPPKPHRCLSRPAGARCSQALTSLNGNAKSFRCW